MSEDNKDKPIQIELSAGDIDTLQKYIRDIKYHDVYVELGTAHGGGILMAREAANKDVDVYTVDYINVLRGDAVGNKDINFIEDKSVDATEKWDTSKRIAVLFIDADHNQAKDDFLIWEKHLTNDAIVLFHDYAAHSPNVIKDCDELFEGNKKYEILYIPGKSKEIVNTSIYQIRILGDES